MRSGRGERGQPVPGIESRRALLKCLFAVSVSMLPVIQRPALAEGSTKVWGAAELDAAMYMCGATGKIFNNPMFCPPKTKTNIPPPRTLDLALASALAQIPSAILTDTLAVDPAAVASTASALRASLDAAFQRRAPFAIGDMTNQFAFDYGAYIDWKAAAMLLPAEDARRRFLAAVGRRALAAYDARAGGLEPALAACKALLGAFQTGGLVQTYTLDDSDYDQRFWSKDSPPTTIVVTLERPATLQACLQATGEGASLRPDYIVPMLEAYLEECHVTVESNIFFLDSQFRPNPDDYQPDQIVVQMYLRQAPK